MPLDGRLMSAFVKRAEQLKNWEGSETNNTPVDIPKHRPSRIKFPSGCVFLAACGAGDTEEVRRLLDQGADVDTINVDGLTALHQACIDENLTMVKFLVETGADVNKIDNEGWTPLHATVSCGNVDIAKYLIEKGANVAVVNNDGELPVDLAESEEMEHLLQKEIEKLGIDCDSIRTVEETVMLQDALNWASRKEVADNIHARTGASALHVAAAKGYRKVMLLLTQAGADLNAQDYDGWTPLHAAAYWGQRDACELLAENLANMTIKNYVGQTCFDVADGEMVKYLDELRKKQESMERERPEVKEILQRTARSLPVRKPSLNRSSAERITYIKGPRPVEKEEIKVKFAPIIEAEPPAVDRSEEKAHAKEEITKVVSQRIYNAEPVKKRADQEVHHAPRRILRQPSSPPPSGKENNPFDLIDELITGETEEENKENVMITNNPDSDETDKSVKSRVPPKSGERSEMQRKHHAKRTRETRRPTQGVTSDELKLAQKLILQKMALKEGLLAAGSPGSDEEEEEDEDEEEEEEPQDIQVKVPTGGRYGPRYGSAGSLPDSTVGSTSSLVSSTDDGDKDYQKLYFEEKEENDRLKEQLRKSEENLTKITDQLQRALQNNSKNEAEKKERRTLERKISEMEEELKILGKLKNDNEKLKAENRALTRTVSKLSKK